MVSVLTTSLYRCKLAIAVALQKKAFRKRFPAIAAGLARPPTSSSCVSLQTIVCISGPLRVRLQVHALILRPPDDREGTAYGSPPEPVLGPAKPDPSAGTTRENRSSGQAPSFSRRVQHCHSGTRRRREPGIQMPIQNARLAFRVRSLRSRPGMTSEGAARLSFCIVGSLHRSRGADAPELCAPFKSPGAGVSTPAKSEGDGAPRGATVPYVHALRSLPCETNAWRLSARRPAVLRRRAALSDGPFHPASGSKIAASSGSTAPSEPRASLTARRQRAPRRGS